MKFNKKERKKQLKCLSLTFCNTLSEHLTMCSMNVFHSLGANNMSAFLLQGQRQILMYSFEFGSFFSNLKYTPQFACFLAVKCAPSVRMDVHHRSLTVTLPPFSLF